MFIVAAAAGYCTYQLGFSDNNGNAPSSATAHPTFGVGGNGAAGGAEGWSYGVVDVPLNAAGQIYNYGISQLNCTIASMLLGASAIGFYMGD
jgi:hypothetical protein